MAELADRTTIKISLKLGKYESILGPVADDVATLVADTIRAQISLNDHTLKELRALGHPYRIGEGAYARVAKKSGRFYTGIRAAARLIREGTLGHDIKLVHQQSGSLTDAVFSETSKHGKTVRITGGIDREEVEDYDPIWLITGTRKMIGRDFILAAKLALRPKLARLVKEKVNEAIQTIAATT